MSDKRMAVISSNDHLQVVVHLERIKAIADSICTLDIAGHCDALLPHTLQYLAETIDSEVNAAEEVLSHAEVAS